MFRGTVTHVNCLCVVCIFIGQFVGCAPAGVEREYADVSGTVKLEGKRLTTGTVAFRPDNGPSVTGKIEEDGTYNLKGVIGPNKVMIISHEPLPIVEPDTPPKLPPPMLKSFIPETYASSSSTLTFDVKAGENKADFDLK